MNKQNILLTKKLRNVLVKRNLKIVTAESCTGGLLAATLTEISGSSEYFAGGFVTYSNNAKIAILGVPKKTLDNFGAVSQETAVAMAKGALKKSHVKLSVAITGIAGPSGGSVTKPVGTVCFAFACRKLPVISEIINFKTLGRAKIRQQAVAHALTRLITFCNHLK